MESSYENFNKTKPKRRYLEVTVPMKQLAAARKAEIRYNETAEKYQNCQASIEDLSTARREFELACSRLGDMVLFMARIGGFEP